MILSLTWLDALIVYTISDCFSFNSVLIALIMVGLFRILSRYIFLLRHWHVVLAFSPFIAIEGMAAFVAILWTYYHIMLFQKLSNDTEFATDFLSILVYEKSNMLATIVLKAFRVDIDDPVAQSTSLLAHSIDVSNYSFAKKLLTMGADTTRTLKNGETIDQYIEINKHSFS